MSSRDRAARVARAHNTTVVITVLRADTGRPAFDLVFYGVSARDLTSVAFAPDSAPPDWRPEEPIEGEIVREALRRRGLDPDDYVSSPFFVREEPRLKRDELGRLSGRRW